MAPIPGITRTSALQRLSGYFLVIQTWIIAFCTIFLLPFNNGPGPILLCSHQSWFFKENPKPKETNKLSDRYGLRVVLDLPNESARGEVVNIVFVHGLGGSARGTWTYEPDAKFWPSWLHNVEGLQNTRIMTFGYDADWYQIWNPKNLLDISDFGTQLLDQLFLHYSKYPSDTKYMNVCRYDTLFKARHRLYSSRIAWVA
jgi:hypothetical protein